MKYNIKSKYTPPEGITFDVEDSNESISNFKMGETTIGHNGYPITVDFKAYGYNFEICVFHSPLNGNIQYLLHYEDGENFFFDDEPDEALTGKTLDTDERKMLVVIGNCLVHIDPPQKLLKHVVNFIRKNQSKTKKGK